MSRAAPGAVLHLSRAKFLKLLGPDDKTCLEHLYQSALLNSFESFPASSATTWESIYSACMDFWGADCDDAFRTLLVGALAKDQLAVLI